MFYCWFVYCVLKFQFVQMKETFGFLTCGLYGALPATVEVCRKKMLNDKVDRA